MEKTRKTRAELNAKKAKQVEYMRVLKKSLPHNYCAIMQIYFPRFKKIDVYNCVNKGTDRQDIIICLKKIAKISNNNLRTK
jgi:hypothetical protein